MGDPVSEAAITGAALIRHLDDVRFASLRALRQLLRALDAERIVIGFVSEDGEYLKEELVWASGFARCGESERVMPCGPLAERVRAWLGSPECAVCIGIDARSQAWHDVPCDHLLLVRGDRAADGAGRLVLAAQLRSAASLPDGAAHAIAILLNEYGQRRSRITP